MQCFICLEVDPPPIVVCECNWLPVHPKCQKRWIETTGHSECQHCKTKYRNVNLSLGFWKCDTNFYFFVSFVLMECVLISTIVYLVVDAAVFDHSDSLYPCFGLLFLMFVVIVLTLVFVQKYPLTRVTNVRPALEL